MYEFSIVLRVTRQNQMNPTADAPQGKVELVSEETVFNFRSSFKQQVIKTNEHLKRLIVQVKTIWLLAKVVD